QRKPMVRTARRELPLAATTRALKSSCGLSVLLIAGGLAILAGPAGAAPATGDDASARPAIHAALAQAAKDKRPDKKTKAGDADKAKSAANTKTTAKPDKKAKSGSKPDKKKSGTSKTAAKPA